MRVLSLFDGISCGQVALQRANIPVSVYYASEIDKYAIQITQKNHPNTIQLGSVTDIDFTQFVGKIDLLIGGSPCQDLSVAGKRKGLSGERSGLFYKFVEALETIKPKYFLLENNVGMPQDAYEEISRLLGIYPIMINSALVSAQQRKRYYWTNIGEKVYNLFGFPTCAIPQPKDKCILLKDVLQSGIAYLDKSYCLKEQYCRAFFEHDIKTGQNTQVAEPLTPYAEKRYYDFADKIGYIPKMFNPYNCVEIKDKTPTLTAQGGSQTKTSTVMIMKPVQIGHIGNTNAQANRVYTVQNKAITLKANGGGGGAKTGLYKIDLPDGDYVIRKLTPIECERLQTLEDNYTSGISDTQRYKCIGNGWTVDVIAHIFSFIGKG